MWFKRFGGAYNVGRGIPIRHRPEALPIIQRRLVERLPKLNDPSSGIRLVEKLVEDLRQAGLTTRNGRITSCLSKIAYLRCPEIYLPYDLNARLALVERLGIHIPEHDYVAFMGAFDRAYSQESHTLKKLCTSPVALQTAKGQKLGSAFLRQKWWWRRLFDWILWREGERILARRKTDQC